MLYIMLMCRISRKVIPPPKPTTPSQKRIEIGLKIVPSLDKVDSNSNILISTLFLRGLATVFSLMFIFKSSCQSLVFPGQ